MRTKRMNRRLCFWNFTPLIPSWQRLIDSNKPWQKAGSLRRTLSRLAPNFPYRRGLLALALLLPATALAGPTGGQVTAGSATITRPNGVTTLITQQTPKAVIDWQNFSIAQQEMVRFLQPDAGSIALNRVLGNDPSQIFGSLLANGQVFLVNPAGVLFGPTSQVSVQGLLATTHDIANPDFMAGRYSFARTNNGLPEAQVVNQGNLQAKDHGYIVLAGDYAANSGVIQARLGKVALASGNRFTLDLDGDQLIGLAVDEASLAKQAGVENFGSIAADGGQVLMTARVANDLATTVVNNTGLVQARSIEEQNGEIILHGGSTGIVANSGTLDASGRNNGESGGSVRMLGEKVGLFDKAVVDVSGANGGGTVLIGGDYQGKNPKIQNAQATFLEKDAGIKADATRNGDGGTVILWSDNVTRAYGSISAQGGQSGGDGGFVEVSGKRYLDYHAHTDTSSPTGRTGTLLLDPASIVITAGTGDGSIMGVATATTDFTGYPGVTPGTIVIADAGPTTVYQSEIVGQSASTNIVFQATDGISTSGTFATPVTLAINKNLTLQTRNDSGDAATGINIASAEFQTQGTGTITIETGVAGAASPQAAPITVGKLTTAGGNVTITSTSAINLQNALNANTGTIALTAGAGGIAQSSGVITAGALKVTSAGNVSFPDTNAVTTIAANVTGAGSTFGYEGTSGFSIGNVGGMLGVTISNGNITIRGNGSTPIQIAENVNAGTGNVLIGQAAVGQGGDIDVAATKSVLGNNVQMYTADSGGNLTNNGTVNASASITMNIPGVLTNSNTGALSGPSLSLTANNMTLQAGSTIGAGSGTAWLQPYTAGQLIDLGGADAVGTLGLDTNELNTITTTGLLRVGAMTAGNLNISAAIAPANVTTLSLESGGTITQAGAGTISATNLAIKALGDVTLDTASNLVTNLAANIGDGSNKNKNFKFKNSPALNIGSGIDSTSGISISIDANSFIPGTPNGIIALTTGASLTQSAGAVLAGKAVYAEGGRVVLPETNPTGVIAGKATGVIAGDIFNYKSSSAIQVSTVNSFSGIQSTGPEPTGVLLAAGSGGVSQDATAPITASTGLMLTTTGPVDLDNAANSVAALAATGVTNLYFNETTALTLGITGNGISTSANGPINITAGGLMTVQDQVNAGSGALGLGATNIQLGAAGTAGTSIAGGLVKLRASQAAGAISSAAGATSTTTINGTDIAMEADNFTYPSFAPSLTATHAISYTTATDNGNISISGLGSAANTAPWLIIGNDTATDTNTTGDISVNAAITRPGGGLILLAGGGISQTAAISANALAVFAGNVDSAGAVALNTPNSVVNLAAETHGGNISLTNAAALNIATLTDGVHAATGVLSNNGNVTITTSAGNITLSSLLNAGTGQVFLTSTGGALVDGNGAGVNNVTASTLDISAYSGIDLDAQVPTASVITSNELGTVTVRPYPPVAPPPVAPPPPTLDACTADPTLAGCTTVLPTLDTCIVTPTAPGCTTVLPLLTDCTTNPTLAGCSVVLPALATCITTPTAPGCTAVLPLLTDCATNPTLAGCSAVLPALAICIATPTAPGCTAVLPRLTDCTTNPTLAGCSAVLPALATCIATPTAPGCTVVLPPLADCTTNPALPGCTAVLPTIATCTATPTAPGCTTVLPPLATCVTDPTLPGCTAVLPLPPSVETPVEIVQTIQAVVIVDLVMPNQIAPTSNSEQSTSASQSNSASGNGNTEENRERRVGETPLATAAQELPLARQPIFDLSGGGIAGQNMVCR
ncbi:MAG: filamentous hemagglutinin N-terminal domain-containing protein [Deltaproteobacteria bacterium]|nr:filamentous hemagglutinin N-terminal domain-containing protein [Deltaproteobacteria bacterium]